MENLWREAVSAQFGAALDMLENAIAACPDDLWRARDSQPQFWYLTYHTLFWTDLYLSGSRDGFAPPPPFTVDELDANSGLPPRVYDKPEILSYLQHCRDKAAIAIGDLNGATMSRTCSISAGRVTYAELLLYNLRHIQHGAGQLNLLLRRGTQTAPRWVGRSPIDRGSEGDTAGPLWVEGTRAGSATPSPNSSAAEGSMYGLIGKMSVAPGQRDLVEAALLDGTAAMPGCLSYVIARDRDDPNALWITEVWDSAESHRASLQLPAVQAAIARARPFITGFSNRVETTPIGGSGLLRAG